IEKLPKKIIAYTGVDALCHAIECYTSNKANDISNLFSLEALKLIYENLEQAYIKEDMKAKEKMLLAAYYAGVAIAAAGTTAVHALSYPLGGKYRMAHGLSNAMLLLPVMKENKDVIEDRLEKVYDYIWGRDSSENKAEAVLQWMEELLRILEIPTSLKEFNIDEKDLDYLAEAAFGVKRLLNNNMKEYDVETIKQIYLEIM
ncbi:MAG TPA: iron-containing alcohol dehydrogenase, partial [Tissierellaceae bacterium]|nr:iron-containing alcohol dehydrogenase [Tissierellaceae bacterium]